MGAILLGSGGSLPENDESTNTISLPDSLPIDPTVLVDGVGIGVPSHGMHIPAGGLTDQVLTKLSDDDYAMAWEDPAASETSYENGLTELDNVVRLGGALTQNTNIDIENNLFSIYFDDSSYSGKIEIGDSTFSISTWDQELYAGNRFSIHMLGAITLIAHDGANSIRLDITETSFEIADTVNSKGVVYGGDYSGNFTDRSLVDKGYVDSVISGASYWSRTTGTPNYIKPATSADWIYVGGGIHFEGLDGVISVDDGSASDGYSLTIQAGNPDGATNDGGTITIKAGNAIFGDSGSVPGGIFLDPGNQYAINNYHPITLGSSVSTATAFEILAEGTASNIHIAIGPKGTGQFRTLASTNHLYNSQFIHIGSAAEWRVTSSYTLEIHGGDGNTDQSGKDTTIRGGSGNGIGDGGDLFLRPGFGGASGIAGNMYFGTGSSGYLGNDDTETDIVAYDTVTGLLTYRSVASIGGSLSFGTSDQIPHMNIGGTDFEYTDNFRYHSSGYMDIVKPGAATSYIRAQYNYFTIYVLGTLRTALTPSASDSAIAVAYQFDTSTNFATAGAKLVSVQNNNVEKFFIDKDGSTWFNGSVQVGNMTTTERDALTPANGMIIYNTTTNAFNFRENGTWVTK